MLCKYTCNIVQADDRDRTSIAIVVYANSVDAANEKIKGFMEQNGYSVSASLIGIEEIPDLAPKHKILSASDTILGEEPARMLTIEWPDGTITGELVSPRAAKILEG